MGRKPIETERVDKAVGLKITELRITMGLSRLKIGQKIGVTHQQVLKYEGGTNNVILTVLLTECNDDQNKSYQRFFDYLKQYKNEKK